MHAIYIYLVFPRARYVSIFHSVHKLPQPSVDIVSLQICYVILNENLKFLIDQTDSEQGPMMDFMDCQF
jgi:hypothetical protein